METIEKTKEFKPIVIKYDDPLKYRTVKSSYESLFKSLNGLLIEFREFMKIPEEEFMKTEFDFLQFYELLELKEPYEYFMKLYIKTHNVEIPGISTQKLIEAGLVDADPKNVLKYLNDAQFQITCIRTDNCWLEILIDEFLNKEECVFKMNASFDKLMEPYFEIRTTNEDQNKAIAAIQQICDGLNCLRQMGVFRSRRVAWPTVFYLLQYAINQCTEINPFAINYRVLNARVLKILRRER